MDGEFDRELDDGGWRKAAYKPLLVQIRKQARAAGLLESGDKRERVERQTQKQLENLIKENNKTGEEKEPLGKLMWQKHQEITDKRNKLGAEQKTTMSKWKREKEHKALTEDRQDWAKKAIQWQGLEHQMKDTDTQPEKKGGTPPPYTHTPAPQQPLPTAPTASLYPVLQVTLRAVH